MVYTEYTIKTVGFECLGKFLWRKERHAEETLNEVNVPAQHLLRFQCVNFLILTQNKII